MQPITIALVLLLLHGAMGAFDTFYNHEWRERLPHRASASGELALHSARSWLFALTFLALAWIEWRGLWAVVPPLLIAAEYLVTLADSVTEDKTRRLRPVERVNHMLLGLNTGLYAAFVCIQSALWLSLPTRLVIVRHPWLSELLTACSIACVVWAVRDALASIRLRAATPPSASLL